MAERTDSNGEGRARRGRGAVGARAARPRKFRAGTPRSRRAAFRRGRGLGKSGGIGKTAGSGDAAPPLGEPEHSATLRPARRSGPAKGGEQAGLAGRRAPGTVPGKESLVVWQFGGAAVLRKNHRTAPRRERDGGRAAGTEPGPPNQRQGFPQDAGTGDGAPPLAEAGRSAESRPARRSGPAKRRVSAGRTGWRGGRVRG